MIGNLITLDRYDSNSTLGVIKANAESALSFVDSADTILKQINEKLQKIKTLATQSADIDTPEPNRYQLQEEVDQLTEDIHNVAYSTEFNATRLIGDYVPAVTASICSVASGVDMSKVILNAKDSRLSGNLVECIKDYIYSEGELGQGTNIMITVSGNGRASINGYINRAGTGTTINGNSYNMISTVNSTNGDVSFSGYGLSFTIPIKEFMNILSGGMHYSGKKCSIRIDTASGIVYAGGSIPTKDNVYYNGTGTLLKDFIISGVDNLTSICISGNTRSNTLGATRISVNYTLADDTHVTDYVYNYSGQILGYSGAGGLKIKFNSIQRAGSYGWFGIKIPTVYKLSRAGGIKSYKHTCKVVSIPKDIYQVGYRNQPMSLDMEDILYNIFNYDYEYWNVSTQAAATQTIIYVDRAITYVSNQIAELEPLKKA